jgi:thymidylate synthase
MLSFPGTTANEAWLAAARKFREPGAARVQPSRAGDTLELLHVSFDIADSRQRWVTSRVPAMNPAFALAEVMWILSGSNDAEFVNTWNPALPRFCGTGPTYHGAYGYRLRRHHGLDQLQRAYEAFTANPETRQVVLQIWDSAIDLPNEDGSPVDPDVPCNVASLLKVRDGRLEWMQVMRSNDLALGAPHNFVQFTSIQEVLSGWIGVTPGRYTHVADSLQVYIKDEADLARIEGHEPSPNTDRLDLAKPEFDRVFAEMHERARAMITADTASGLHGLTQVPSLPEGYANILRVMAADLARRRGWLDLAFELRNACSNTVLATALDGWFARMIPEHEQDRSLATNLSP